MYLFDAGFVPHCFDLLLFIVVFPLPFLFSWWVCGTGICGGSFCSSICLSISFENLHTCSMELASYFILG